MTNSKDVILVKGVIKSVERNSLCKVLLDNGITVNATPSGKLRKFSIRLLPGDTVDVELSPYDLTKGRVTYRYK